MPQVQGEVTTPQFVTIFQKAYMILWNGYVVSYKCAESG